MVTTRRPGTRKKPRRLEEGLQGKFLSRIVPMLLPEVRVHAIPNGGYRIFSEAVRLKASGVRRGITDLVFVAPAGRTGWLETKQGKGTLDDEQEGFRNICLRNGHLWGMYKTVDEGVDQLRAWGFLKREY